MTASPRFLTLAQVAEELATTEILVKGLITRGELRAFQLGGRGQWRIGREDLEDFIAGLYAQQQPKLPDDPAHD